MSAFTLNAQLPLAVYKQRNAMEKVNGNVMPTEKKQNGIASNGNGNFSLSATVFKVLAKSDLSGSYNYYHV